MDASGSSSHTYSSHADKRPRIDNYDYVAKFKGVVAQQNGHWGAQIYANYQRVWLGTFKSENDAAMAYDSAAIMLRSRDSHRNFPCTNITHHEQEFQSHYSSEAILNMIKDGSYLSKFSDFLRGQMVEEELGLNLARVHGNPGSSFELLFQKELTPSDVGKLNRLVVPKKFAVKYFPHPGRAEDRNNVQLFFYDKQMREWQFRYCYWKSSQSFVFTRGWNRYVKEMKIKAKDIVIFYKFEDRERANEEIFIIEVANKEVSSNDVMVEVVNQNVGLQEDLSPGFGENFNCISVKEEIEDFEDLQPTPNVEDLRPTPNVEKKSFRLFGQIIIIDD